MSDRSPDPASSAPLFVQATGDVNVGGDLVGGDLVGRDKVVHGYSADQVQPLLADLARHDHPRPVDGRCPYPGLAAFGGAESLTHGRLDAATCERYFAGPCQP